MTDTVAVELQPLGARLTLARGAPLRLALAAHGVEFPCGGEGRCGGCKVRVLRGASPPDATETEILTRAELADGWRLACRGRAAVDVTLEVGQWDTVILADHAPFAFAPRDGCGIAVDLGSTTIVAQLLDLRTGHVLGLRTLLNPGTAHGGDVMSRITHALAADGRATLVADVRAAVGRLAEALAADALPGAPPLDSVVIVGNTVMHHLFCDLDVRPLARAPFEPLDAGPHRFRARALDWALPGDPPVRALPCLGGFVGSDILCGILATRMTESDAPLALLDLGTNGEIVIGNRAHVCCASTAAGPAFEGGRIGMGMRAGPGAVSEVAIEGGRLRCRVIGDEAPRGICGSGLVDAVAAALDLGLVEPGGRLAGGAPALDLAPPVRLTQRDVRELQLAKAAVAAGLHLLRERFGAAACADAPIYLAGAFGNYVNRRSARRIGLVDAPEDRVRAAGNTALMGAKMALFRDADADDFADLRARIEHVPLAGAPAFERAFIDALAFPAGA